MTEREFLDAIAKAQPGDDLPRLAYADWLEERSDPRAAIVRSPIGRIAYRDHPEAGVYSVASAWERLKRWSLLNVPVPEEEGDDPPPAQEPDPQPVSEAQLREFEAAIGTTLPTDVRESYGVYDGQCAGVGVVYGLPVTPLGANLQDWRRWSEAFTEGATGHFDSGCSSFPDGFVRPVYFDPGWIPLTDDSGGNYIAVDLNPGPKGRRGQVIIFGRDDQFHPVLALSWGQFLTDLAEELEAGNFRLDLSNPDYPILESGVPTTKHFHMIGAHWSRGKLGLRSLSAVDQEAWKQHGKICGPW